MSSKCNSFETYPSFNLNNYQSAITRFDFSSKGRCTSLFSNKDNRELNFLSDLERDYYDIISFNSNVIQIFDQIPLLPLEDTLLISEALGIKHPQNNNRTPVIMTSDYLIKFKKGKEINYAIREVKPSEKLRKRRVLEKFIIGETFWRKKGITDWKIITEKQINSLEAQNIRDLKHYSDLSKIECFKECSDQEIKYLCKQFINLFYLNNEDVNKTITAFNQTMGNEIFGVRIYKYLALNKIVPVELKMKNMGIKYQ